MKCLAQSGSSADSRLNGKKIESSPGLKGQEKSAGAACPPSSSSRHNTWQPKGRHNKENSEKRSPSEVPPDEDLLSSSSSLSEDSGYLSLHNSQLEQSDAGASEVAQRGASPDVHPGPNSFCLPVLKFQEEVCRELAKNYRRSQCYDWSVIDELAEQHGLHNVIGTKIGLDNVDILCGLFQKSMRHILSIILSLLDDCDLISCKKVSKTWRDIICQDENALQRCQGGEEVLKDSLRSRESLSRDFGLSRVVFSCLQSVASSTPIPKPIKKNLSKTDGALSAPRPSRFTEFHEAAKSLKKHESLKCCRLCNSPARFDASMQRAVCMRVSCAFEFCSLCQSKYHGSTPCQRGTVRSTPRNQKVLLIGSAISKRNVRRL